MLYLRYFKIKLQLDRITLLENAHFSSELTIDFLAPDESAADEKEEKESEDVTEEKKPETEEKEIKKKTIRNIKCLRKVLNFLFNFLISINFEMSLFKESEVKILKKFFIENNQLSQIL